MKPWPDSPYISQGGSLSLSNLGQLELLLAMVERGVPLRTTARGFSMHPFIRDKDVLTIAPMKDILPAPGDVVAFTQPETGRLAIHRVIEQKEKGWLIRGDNCLEPDGVIPGKNILGIVVRVERGGKNIRLGIGKARLFIAILNRCNALTHLRQIWTLPYRMLAFLVYRLQSLSVYRKLIRRFAPPINIFVAGEDDMEEIHDRLNPFVPYRREKSNPNVVNWVARNGQRLAGFIQYVYHPASHAPWTGHWLFSLHVWTRYRGMGLGTKLTHRVIEEATAQGADELCLVVNDDNQRAIRLYHGMGFEVVIIPGLKPLFEKEKMDIGRRRIVMKKQIGAIS